MGWVEKLFPEWWEQEEERRVQELLDANPLPYSGEFEWEKRISAALRPTPGYTRTYSEMLVEAEAAGLEIPETLRLLAAGEHWAEGEHYTDFSRKRND